MFPLNAERIASAVVVSGALLASFGLVEFILTLCLRACPAGAHMCNGGGQIWDISCVESHACESCKAYEAPDYQTDMRAFFWMVPINLAAACLVILYRMGVYVGLLFWCFAALFVTLKASGALNEPSCTNPSMRYDAGIRTCVNADLVAQCSAPCVRTPLQYKYTHLMIVDELTFFSLSAFMFSVILFAAHAWGFIKEPEEDTKKTDGDAAAPQSGLEEKLLHVVV